MDQKLSTFLTLCSTMNYRRAADALHLTQPAVTKQIQALEAQYGVKLFSYDERKLRKTPQGEILERYATACNTMTPSLRACLQKSRRRCFASGQRNPSATTFSFRKSGAIWKCQDNELYFTVDNTAHLLAQLEAGELDFVILEGIFDKRRYDHFLLRAEPYIGICAKDHPWSGKHVALEELFSERLILREPGSGTRNILERELFQQGYGIEAFQSRVCISSFKTTANWSPLAAA